MEVSLLHATRLVYFLIIHNQNTKQARIDSAICTEEAGLKHTYTLVTVDSDCVSNLLYTPTKKKAARADSSSLHLSG